MAAVIDRLVGGKMTPTGVLPKFPNHRNFVICCEYGDWSGFRTLEDCRKQYSELESYNRPQGYFWTEER